jgi:AcrR family transcriptional regulator
MPKLDEKKMAERVRRIEEAARVLFTRRGFHGVGLRDIADEAGVSLGNIYNHFSGKEPIFASLIQRLYGEFVADSEPLAEVIRRRRFPDDLEAMGEAIGEMVDRHADYLTLVYVDIAEFDGKHVRPHYENLAAKFDFLMKERFDALRKERALPKGVDPAVAFTLIYMQFSNYFIVERLIGARHLGLDHRESIRAIAKLFTEGLRPRSKKK